MSNLSLAIIDGDSQARNQLAGILGMFSGSLDILASESFEEGMRRIEESRPQIVILDVREISQGARETSTILSRSPQTTIFVTCDEKNPDWILRLMRAGAGEYLTKPVNAGELVDAVKKVTRFRAEAAVPTGSAVAVYNPSGGMGTTTTAVNLAATLQSRGETVALLDLNLLAPDVATFLDLTPRYTLSDIFRRNGDLDANLVRSLLVSHPSGIQVLAGPAHLTDPERLSPELVHRLMAVLRNLFSYLVIDTGGPLSRCNLTTFLDCEQILYTTVLNLPGLKNGKLYLAALEGQGLGKDRVKLVINRFHPNDDITVASAEKVLSAKAYATIPNAWAETKYSITRGEPVVRSYPRSPIAKAMDQVAGRLTQELAGSRNMGRAIGGLI